jgi:hypothetical protein
MIKGHIDSGRRMLFDYSAGTNRATKAHSNSLGDEARRKDRADREEYSVQNLLVTLGFAALEGRHFRRRLHRVAARALV